MAQKKRSRPTRSRKAAKQKNLLTASLLAKHFGTEDLHEVMVAERRFPFRVRTELMLGIDDAIRDGLTVKQFVGIRKLYDHAGLTFGELMARDDHYPATVAPAEYEEIDVGEALPLRCLKRGLWLATYQRRPVAVLLTPHMQHGEQTQMTVQVASLGDDAEFAASRCLFETVESRVRQASSYRGKTLSLEASRFYGGKLAGITVHKLHSVSADQIILPAETLGLLERNVLRFVEQRELLRSRGMSTKKGLLFYGPPGTGKTHTVYYLASSLPGHTTLLIAGDQIGLLDEYMALARLLQPSIVVIEDADLIAGHRSEASVCEETLLNKLLNEMDGLREDADILFVLTTNRPQSLEAALASRPGRVDQAIEFPLPDDVGRAKLVRMYAGRAELTAELVEKVVRRTERTSAAFIKELMRRATQYQLSRDSAAPLQLADVELALEEMLFTGGSLNRLLLGGAGEGDDE